LWLLALTIILAAMARNIASIELARSAGPVPVATLDLDQTGPQAGASLPDDLVAVAQSAGASPTSTLVFVSPGCGTCLEVVDDLTRKTTAPAELMFVVIGATGTDSAIELREVLARSSAPILDGDDARLLMRGFGVASIPFAIRLDGPRVARSRYLRKASDISAVLTDAAA
jgi:hypothetical protein